MEIRELISKSPIRAFEDALDGGLGRGNLGVLVSQHGVGKSACMVHLALDKIIQDLNVVHVSFGANVEHMMNWYKEVFREITDFRSLEDAVDVYETIRRNRVMMNFSQENTSVETIINSLGTLIRQGSFKADAIFFDGYKLTVAAEEDVRKIKQFAQEMNVEVWFSVSPVRPDVQFDEYGVPESMNPYKPIIDVLVGLHYNDERSRVIMTIVKCKDREIPRPSGVSLDPKTMLIEG